MTTWLWLLVALLLLAGLAGTILPALPGTPLIFAGLFLAAWIDGFQKVGWFPLTILGILTVLSFAIDFVATSLGAKRVGASKEAIIGAALGTVAGLLFGLIGVFVAPFVGAVAGELVSQWRKSQSADQKQALKAGLATWLGILLGTATKLALAFTMIGIFAIAYLI
ncbi:MAG: DUF456 domain-containing protein [Acidobacteria bacterium]|nr:DUF456 domain-containing protein [Acidobacteriota bacterium]MCG3195155.1 hypothetical protein [Thermoanaerobaculia bacterium]MCK6683216.1 DUF456 domain-containing protein [Thermoanaerobaculia bacterium]